MSPRPILRGRVWIDGVLVEEMEIGLHEVDRISESQAERWNAELDAGHRCRVVVDDPDFPEYGPWFEATETGEIISTPPPL